MFLVSLLGCNRLHLRPANVPQSAVWVDATFIDCSVEPQSRANRCTVYKDDNGEILADGLFVLLSTYDAAVKTELHYVAFGKQGIVLEDLRILTLLIPSERDPSHRIIDEKLRMFASNNGIEALDCNKAAANSDAAAECANTAIRDKRAFHVRFFEREPDSFGYVGFAGPAGGTVSGVFYSHGQPRWMDGMPSEEHAFDSDHLLVLACPKPTVLKNSNGRIPSCFPTVSRE
jgi:hypothetical protein